MDPGVLATRLISLWMGVLALGGLVLYLRSGQFTEEAKHVLWEGERGSGEEVPGLDGQR